MSEQPSASRVVLRAIVACLAASLASLPCVAKGAAESAAPSAVLDCRDPIGAAETPPSDVTVIGGALALRTRRSTRRALQTTATSDPSMPVLRFFAKTPLFVRSATAAQIIVPRKQMGRVAMTWGNSDHDGIATHVFAVEPCRSASKWIVFPGGYFLTRPACIDLIVRVAGDATRVRIGVGAPCPGQQPPPEPSDS